MGLNNKISQPFHEIPCANNQPWHLEIGQRQVSFSTELDAENAIKFAEWWAMTTTHDIREEVTNLLDRF